MPADLRLTALGSVVSVPVDGEERSRLAAQWSRCLADDAREPVATVVPSTQEDRDGRDYALAGAVTRAAIDQARGRCLMFHACGVSDPATGRSIVLVAPSGTGKTTAAAMLCAADFGYLSDETVAIDADGMIRPYPKPLSVVLTADRPGHKSQHGPDELGLLPAHARPVAAMLILLDRSDQSAGGPRLEPMPLLEAALALIPHTSALPALDDPLKLLCDRICALGGAKRLHYTDIADAAGLLRAELAGCRPLERHHIHLPQPVDEAMPPATGGSGESVCRAPYSDAVADGDEALVLVGNVPSHLRGLGATIWRAAARPATMTDLTRVCVEAHGEHPQAASLVEQAVQTLLTHGLLQAA